MSHKANIDTVIGFITEATPNINNILNILLPIIFPIAILSSPFFVAIADVTNSGNEVPTATIVNPTKFSLIPNLIAMALAELTTKSPPQTIAISPNIPNTIVMRLNDDIHKCLWPS